MEWVDFHDKFFVRVVQAATPGDSKHRQWRAWKRIVDTTLGSGGSGTMDRLMKSWPALSNEQRDQLAASAALLLPDDIT